MDNKEYLDKLREFIAEEVRKEVAKQLQGLTSLIDAMQDGLNASIDHANSNFSKIEDRINSINGFKKK